MINVISVGYYLPMNAYRIAATLSNGKQILREFAVAHAGDLTEEKAIAFALGIVRSIPQTDPVFLFSFPSEKLRDVARMTIPEGR